VAPRKTKVQKKELTKESVIPQKVGRNRQIDPNIKWKEMKEQFSLDDDEMPDYLRLEIENYNPRAKTRLSKAKPNKPLNHILQAEATIKSLLYPQTPQVVRKCKNEKCGELFRSSYESVAHCSDYCRKERLAGLFGIEWVEDQYSSKNEIELWMGQVPPMIVPQQVLAVMKYLVLDSESQIGVEIEPWNPKNRKPVQVVSEPIEPEAVPIEPSPIPQTVESLPQLSMQERLSKIRARTALGKSVR